MGFPDYNFYTLQDGRQAFYPYIIARRGYVVSERQRARLARYMVAAAIAFAFTNAIAVNAATGNGAPVGWLPIVLILSLNFAGYYGGLRWLTINMERAPADERPRVTERLRNSAQHSLWIQQLVVASIALLLVLGGLYMATSGKAAATPLVGVAIVTLGVFLALAVAYMAWSKATRNFGTPAMPQRTRTPE